MLYGDQLLYELMVYFLQISLESLNLLESSLTRGKVNLRNHRITSWFDYYSRVSNLNLRSPILKKLLPKKDLKLPLT